MKVLLAHPGTQHSHHLARELDQRELLSEFWTGYAISASSFHARLAQSLSGINAFRGLQSRIVRDINPDRVRVTRFNELRALAQLKQGADGENVLHERNAKFQNLIPDSSLQKSDAIIGFDTSSWILAKRAQAMGKKFWLDRSIGHPAVLERILAELRPDYPNWASAVTPRYRPVIEAENSEHHLAHAIVVGSTFARDTLIAQGIDKARVRINPYGVDWKRFTNITRSQRAQRPLRFLFVGSLQLRKGLPYLLQAWQQLAPSTAELWIVGQTPSDRSLLPSFRGLKYFGQVPYAEIPSIYAQADVFVLPSLFEGFSLAALEALASGLKIIVTPNTGATDALRNPALGTVIKVGSVESLRDAMAQCLDAPPSSEEIRNLTIPLSEYFSWTAYGDRWAALIQEN